jgi:hypothetical protein
MCGRRSRRARCLTVVSVAASVWVSRDRCTAYQKSINARFAPKRRSFIGPGDSEYAAHIDFAQNVGALARNRARSIEKVGVYAERLHHLWRPLGFHFRAQRLKRPVHEEKVKMTPEQIAAARQKALEHLEAALAITDETGDETSGFLIERALDQMRADTWPGGLDVPLR